MIEDKPKSKKRKVAPKTVEPVVVTLPNVGSDPFKMMSRNDARTCEVLPIQGMGCVLKVDSAMVYIPDARYVDGALVR